MRYKFVGAQSFFARLRRFSQTVLLKRYEDVARYDMKAVDFFTLAPVGAPRSGLALADRPRYIPADIP
jgi:hypothetical protein